MKKELKKEPIVSFTHRKSRWIAAIVIAVVMVTLLFCFYSCFKVTAVHTCVGSRNQRTGVITGTPLEQRFITNGKKIVNIKIRFTNCTSEEGSVIFKLYDNNGEEVYEKETPISELTSDKYYSYNINQSVTKDVDYTFTVEAVGVEPSEAPLLWVSNNVVDSLYDVVYSGQTPGVRLQTNTIIGYARFHYIQFTISLVCILLTSFVVLLKLNLSEKNRRVMCFIILLTMPVFMFILTEGLNNNSILGKSVAVYILNYLVYFIIYILFFALTNRLRFTVLFSNIIILLIALINYYKLEFRGEPFTFSDFAQFGTALNVADQYEIHMRYMVFMTICAFMLITAVVSRFRYSMHHIRTRIIVGGLALAMGGLLVDQLFNAERYSASNSSFMQQLNIVNNVWNQKKNFSDNGVLVAITMNVKYLVVSPPEVYSVENCNNALDDIAANYGTSMLTNKKFSDYYRSRNVNEDELPNIICIMDESYSDFSQFDIELSKPYSPFIDSLEGNVIKGDLHVSTFGGGTANSEFEFLTGNTMEAMPSGSIPYQQYIDSDTGSMARLLKNLGYDTYAFHPYLASGWNREKVYQYMDFDQFLSIDDLDDPEYIRSYVSDECSFNEVISLYEQHEEESDAPFFMFNVTMQNHGSYTRTFANFTPDVSYTEDPGKYTEAEQYFSVARNTDSALEDLIRYFKNCDEPTVICFFGDHLPNFDDGFYEHVMGVSSISDLSNEQMQSMYMTDFVVWANYSFVAPEISDISLNYLSTLVMQVAGIPLTEYQLFLTEMYQMYPVLTTMGLYDSDGRYVGSPNLLEGQDIWNYYSILEYNNVFGGSDRITYAFDMPFCRALELLSQQQEATEAAVTETAGTSASSSGRDETNTEN